MSAYNPNIPQPTDFLSNSQQDMLNNFSQANTTMGVDHYSFDDATANNGKHNKVTTPIITGAAHPVTAVNEPKFYAMEDYSAIGVLQYSRGPSDAQPTPLTLLQSPVAPIVLLPSTTTNVLDFTGINSAIFMLYGGNLETGRRRNIVFFGTWIPNVFLLDEIVRTGNLLVLTSGNILQIKNDSTTTNQNNVFWSLSFLRIT
jgi:hypothetical protein